jgi:hypothetical protein
MTIAKILQTLVDGQIKLQESIIASQNKLHQEIQDLRSEMNQRFEENKADHYGIRNDIHKLDGKLTSRIDKIGYQVADLEDDSPTRDEHDKLVKRVEKVEKKVALF